MLSYYLYGNLPMNKENYLIQDFKINIILFLFPDEFLVTSMAAQLC